MLRRQVLNIEDLRPRPEPVEKGDPPALAERFTFHDLRAKSAGDDERALPSPHRSGRSGEQERPHSLGAARPRA